MTEKQAVIIGVGGLAVLFLMKGKASAAPLSKTAKKSAGPAGTVSSGLRPSTNLATQYGTATRAQNPSTITTPVAAIAASSNAFANILDYLLRRQPSQTTQGGAQPKSQSSGTSGGGSGAGSGQASKGAYQPPGGNPWSPSGDFLGKSSVTSSVPDNQGALQGYDTGLSSQYGEAAASGGEVGIVPGQEPQNTALLQSVEADGTPSEDPAAIEYVNPDDIAAYYAGAVDTQPVAEAPLDATQTVPYDSASQFAYDTGPGGGGTDYATDDVAAD